MVKGIFTLSGVSVLQKAITEDGAGMDINSDDVIVLTGIIHRRENQEVYNDTLLKAYIVAYQYRTLNEFDSKILDLFYKAGAVEQARLYLAFHELGEAFFRHGRTKAEVLKVELGTITLAEAVAVYTADYTDGITE